MANQTSTQWQLSQNSAELYERVLVSSILGPAAKNLVGKANLKEGEWVLDVGCGTGAAARFAVNIVGTSGRAVGVDVNQGMLEIAKRKGAEEDVSIEWHQCSIYELPFEDDHFDVVVAAQVVQFLADIPNALKEIHRVLKPGGRFLTSVWSDLKENPYFEALVVSVRNNLGHEVSEGMNAAFRLTNRRHVLDAIRKAKFMGVKAWQEQFVLDLPDLEEFVPSHIQGTPMAQGFEAASDSLQKQIVEDVVETMKPYQDGSIVRTPFRTQLFQGRKA